MDLKSTYNKIAEDWHRDHQSDEWWIEGTEKFISCLASGNLVLDVGCGGGTKSRYLARRGLRVMGIDFSEKMIEIAKREVPEARFEVMDLRDVKNINETFDGIFAQAVLLHIPRQEVEGALETLASKLKSGGCFYLAVKAMKPGGNAEEIVSENDYGYPYGRFFSYYTLEELKKYFSDLRMKISYESVSSSGNTEWIQIIARRVEE